MISFPPFKTSLALSVHSLKAERVAGHMQVSIQLPTCSGADFLAECICGSYTITVTSVTSWRHSPICCVITFRTHVEEVYSVIVFKLVDGLGKLTNESE